MKNKPRTVKQEFATRIYENLRVLVAAFDKSKGSRRPSNKELMDAIAVLHESALIYFGSSYAERIEEGQLERYKENRRRVGKREQPSIEEISAALLPLVDYMAIRESGFSQKRSERKLRLARRKFGVCVGCGEQYVEEGEEYCSLCKE